MNDDLRAIDRQLAGRETIAVERLEAWCGLSSYSRDVGGLLRMSEKLLGALAEFPADVDVRALPDEMTIDDAGEAIAQPLGRLIVARCRPEAPRQVLLGIHYDTVYPSFARERIRLLDGRRLAAPGGADAKGGIVVMLEALRAFEGIDGADELGWELFLNPDEELGSPGSREYLAGATGRFDLALLFEPALPDGARVSSRKGSGNFTLVVDGRAAHAGRDFAAGRNAVVHAARLIERLNGFNGRFGDSTFNVGRVVGGGASNVVPDRAVVRLNVRVDRTERIASIDHALGELVETFDAEEGYGCRMHGAVTSPPKRPDADGRRLIELFDEVDRAVGPAPYGVSSPGGSFGTWRETGGVCDGNKLAAAGIPNVDTCGPVGGELHSEREWVALDSLIDRARRAAMILARHARGTSGLSRFDRLGNNAADG